LAYIDASGDVYIGAGTSAATLQVGVTTFEQVNAGVFKFSSPYSFEVQYKCNQAGQATTFGAVTNEGKVAGIRHYDVANVNGRLAQFFTDPGVAFDLAPGGYKTLSVNNFGTVTVTAQGSWTFIGWNAGESPMVVKGFAAQTADLQQWQDSTTAVKAAICPVGCATFTGLKLGIRTVASAPTLTAADYTVLCDATTAGFTVGLPAVATNTGRILVIKKTDATANTVVIDPNVAELIEGLATATISIQGAFIVIQSSGTAWHIIG